MYAAQGRDIKLDVKRIEGYRAFLNKLWNAARFALMNLQDFEAPSYKTFTETWETSADTPFVLNDLSIADRWILTRLNETIASIQTNLDEFSFNEVAQNLYRFVWNDLCDWYIELIKPALYDNSPEGKATRNAAQATLLYTLEAVLRLMHPITPFITEDIWQSLPRAEDAPKSIMIAPFPTARAELAMIHAHDHMALIIELISSIRAIRGETNVKPGVVIEEVFFVTEDAHKKSAIETGAAYIQRHAKATTLTIVDRETGAKIEVVATAMSDGIEISILLKGLINIE